MYYTYIVHELEEIRLETEENWLNRDDLIAELAADIKQHKTKELANKYINHLKSHTDYSYLKNYIVKEYTK